MKTELTDDEDRVLRVQIFLVRLQGIVPEDFRELRGLWIERVAERARVLRLEEREDVALD